MTTRVEMIIETLQANQGRKFTARELAQAIIERYPQAMATKKKKAGFQTEEELLVQMTAEVGGSRLKAAKKKSPHVATQDIPHPRIYYWGNGANAQTADDADSENGDEGASDALAADTGPSPHLQLSELELYPHLMEYLREELGLSCRRINEKTSSNKHGAGGNKWLHPDIVALERLDQGWDATVRSCVRHGKEGTTRLWSFEVKKILTTGNVRRSFFQAVSNSSLNTVSLFDSQVRFPARERATVDWLSVDRLVKENTDFRDYIDQVGMYRQTGKLIESLWNK